MARTLQVHLVRTDLRLFSLFLISNRELFLWAASVLSSRAFTPEILRSTLPADKASSLGNELPDHEQLTALFREGFPVLVPLVDIANYRPMAQVEWQAGMHDIGLLISESVEAGEQVFNNYGPKGNEQRTSFSHSCDQH